MLPVCHRWPNKLLYSFANHFKLLYTKLHFTNLDLSTSFSWPGRFLSSSCFTVVHCLTCCLSMQTSDPDFTDINTCTVAVLSASLSCLARLWQSINRENFVDSFTLKWKNNNNNNNKNKEIPLCYHPLMLFVPRNFLPDETLFCYWKCQGHHLGYHNITTQQAS